MQSSRRRTFFRPVEIGGLAALSFLALALAFSSNASATDTVLSNATINLKGHQQFVSTDALPWTNMSCFATLTSNGGSVQSHRAGVTYPGPGFTYSAWTTATTAYTPAVECWNSPVWGAAEQSTSASVVRSYTLRVYGRY